jgi:hypothetical protein
MLDGVVGGVIPSEPTPKKSASSTPREPALKPLDRLVGVCATDQPDFSRCDLDHRVDGSGASRCGEGHRRAGRAAPLHALL